MSVLSGRNVFLNAYEEYLSISRLKDKTLLKNLIEINNNCDHKN